MKRIILFCISIQVCTYGFSQFQAKNWSTVKANGQGTLVCIFNESSGMIQADQSGTPQGVCPEIVKDFSSFVKNNYQVDLKVKYVSKEASFSEFLKKVSQSKNVFGIANVSITDERKQWLGFTPKFLSNPMILITHNNVPLLKNYDQLKNQCKGYTAYVIKGSTHVKYIKDIQTKYIPDLKIAYTSSSKETFEKLARDPKGLSIIDFTEFYYAEREKIPVKRQGLRLHGSNEELGFITSKGSDWLPLWEAFLTQEYRSSIRYKQIIRDNLGSAYLNLIK